MQVIQEINTNPFPDLLSVVLLVLHHKRRCSESVMYDQIHWPPPAPAGQAHELGLALNTKTKSRITLTSEYQS